MLLYFHPLPNRIIFIKSQKVMYYYNKPPPTHTHECIIYCMYIHRKHRSDPNQRRTWKTHKMHEVIILKRGSISWIIKFLISFNVYNPSYDYGRRVFVDVVRFFFYLPIRCWNANENLGSPLLWCDQQRRKAFTYVWWCYHGTKYRVSSIEIFKWDANHSVCTFNSLFVHVIRAKRYRKRRAVCYTLWNRSNTFDTHSLPLNHTRFQQM